jgi:predicted ABC-type ATPase
MVAGPNGSGKSTLVELLRTSYSISFGYNLNPDLLERELGDNGSLDFKVWGVTVTEADLQSFLQSHPLAAKAPLPAIKIKGNILTLKADSAGGYFAAIISDFLRKKWVASKSSFTFETVMSSPDKVELLKEARRSGYRTYLYFVCTNSNRINLERVAIRVAQGGHDVPTQKMEQRYDRSISLLPHAVKNSSRAYLFDNSGEEHVLIAEFEENQLVSVAPTPPQWFLAFWQKRAG